jgi:peptide deformylase
MYQIIQAPHEILRKATVPVADFDTKLLKIIEEMKTTLILQKNPEGVGLAANQVGLPYKLFLTHFKPSKTEPVRVFINPEIVAHSQEFQEETKKSPLEGCLSLPKYYGMVKRWKWIKLKYQTTDHGLPTSVDSSQWIESIFEDFPAVVIQHEMDHLEGKIFVERILEQKGKMYKITGKGKNGKDEWEEVEL